MLVFMLILAAVCGYLAAGFNPAIAMSKAIYKQDIRDCGSGNPGFTNFKRTFGNKWAWWVFAIDISKAAIVITAFGFTIKSLGYSFRFGAAFTAMFCMLGHAFPCQYRFKGGKGFLVCLSAMYVIDWRVGLIATAIMCILLITTKYMSLSTTVAMLSCPLLLTFFGSEVSVIIMASFCSVFMTVRHKENFKRLIHGTESKFYLKSEKI